MWIDLPLVVEGNTFEEGNQEARDIRQRHNNVGPYNSTAHIIDAASAGRIGLVLLYSASSFLPSN
jgi:hypothetical protein